MAEITAPIIAITLVLLSVFVPVAFIPGISGELFRQFAVTVAVSMLLSAINALTLSPALCAVLLRRHHGPRRGVIGYVMRSIDRVRDALWRRRRPPGAFLDHRAGHGRRRHGGSRRALPRSLRPDSCPRTTRAPCSSSCSCPAARRSRGPRKSSASAEAILKEEEAVGDVTSVIGLNFIDNYSQSNAAFMVVTLKPFEERKDESLGAPAVIARLGQKFRQIQGGTVVPLAPPPILGLGTGGGFAYVLRGSARRRSQSARSGFARAHWSPPTRIRKLNRVFSTFSATNPSIYLDIDRDKAQILGVPLSNVFQSLQASLGGYYINNMNLFGRTWQVQVQAEATIAPASTTSTASTYATPTAR